MKRFIETLSQMQTNKFHITYETKNRKNKSLINAGFLQEMNEGFCILPNKVGKHSKFNADGMHILLKDKPKEERYVQTIEWSWQQYCGRNQKETVTEFRDVYKPCYQREYIPPPSEELCLIKQDEKFIVTSKEFTLAGIKPESLKHCINLFLELFGECNISDSTLKPILIGNAKRVRWNILPKGKYPWETLLKHIQKNVKSKKSRTTPVIIHRQKTIQGYNPLEIYVGEGGFKDYIAYVFANKKIVVLESMQEGNATYILGKDWKAVSKMTKAEILSGKHHKKRIIHSKGWEGEVDDLLS